MSSVCVDNRLIVHCIFLVLQVVLLTTCIHGTIKFFIYQKQEMDKIPSKTLSIIGSAHLLISIGALGSGLLFYTVEMLTCYKYIWIFFYIFMVFYMLQIYLLWLVLFLRLKTVFNESIYKLSCGAHNVLRSILIFMPIVAILSFSPIPVNKVLMSSIMMIISAAFCIFITTIFVYKLFRVYKHHAPNSRDDGLLSIITKNTILALISIFSTILNSIILIIARNNASNIPLWYFKDFCFVLEMYTNYCCILLTYQYFQKQYFRFCGILDGMCKSCCMGITHGNINNKEQQVASPTITKVNSVSHSPAAVV